MVEPRDPLDRDEASAGGLVIILNGPLGRDRERGCLVAREHSDFHPRHERAQRLVEYRLAVCCVYLRRGEEHERHVRAERGRLVDGAPDFIIGHAVDYGCARRRGHNIRDLLRVPRGQVAMLEVGGDPMREEGRARLCRHALVDERRPAIWGNRFAERDGGRLCAG